MPLPSLGLDSKNSTRNPRNSSKYLLEVPRGFSVHVFKNPTLSTHPYTAAGTIDSSRRSPVGDSRSARSDADRKSTPSRAADSRPSVYEHVSNSKRSKASKPYGIYPGPMRDMYIYEASVNSSADALADSSSSSEEDYFEDTIAASLEISSTRASSSTETLETTAFTSRTHNLTRPGTLTPMAVSRTTSTASASAQGAPGTTHTLLLPQVGHVPSRPNVPNAPSRVATVESASDSDSDTAVSLEQVAPATLGRTLSASLSASTPVTRPPDGRRSAAPSPPLPPALRQDNRQESVPLPRAPPGLYPSAVPTAAPASGSRHSPVREYPGSSSNSQPATAPIISRTSSSAIVRSISRSASQSPVANDGGLVVSTRRCVRWTENLVCPSPVLRSQRRRGWYNRRGDQLWTNDGRYKVPEPGQEYPLDLDTYPEPNTGWMNEDGVRIDMQHRLIPKAPLRPALKRPKIQNSDNSVQSRITITTPSGN